MLTKKQKIIKRTLDITVAILGLIILMPIIIFAWFIAFIETKSNGFYFQSRIGKNGKNFHIIKIKTMYPDVFNQSVITTKNDLRITKFGSWFRKYKIDELPQLFNVLFGKMSLVGPRPDVSGYADLLSGSDKIILEVRPGITGPASLYFRDEEILLSKQNDPKKYNDEVIWHKKIELNKEYIIDYSFKKDIYFIIKTLIG